MQFGLRRFPEKVARLEVYVSDALAAATPAAKLGNVETALSPSGLAKEVKEPWQNSNSFSVDEGYDVKSMPLNVGEFVTLQSLKTQSLNGRSGAITCFIEETGRFGVRLHGESDDKAFLAQNLMKYSCSTGDACHLCRQYLNLNAFPPCECNPASLYNESA